MREEGDGRREIRHTAVARYALPPPASLIPQEFTPVPLNSPLPCP